MKLRLHIVLSCKLVRCVSKPNLNKKSTWTNIYSRTIEEGFLFVTVINAMCDRMVHFGRTFIQLQGLSNVKGPQFLNRKYGFNLNMILE